VNFVERFRTHAGFRKEKTEMEGNDELSTGGERNEPVFWFSEYWMQCIYVYGIDRVLRLMEKNPPRRYLEDGVLREEGDSDYFYWRVIEDDKMELADNFFRLYGKKRKGSQYSPVIDLRKGDDGHYRVYAARNFKFGDAIIFFPEFEEKRKSFILGGTYARVVDERKFTNAYLTKNRVVRCLQSMEKGEEVVLWTKENRLTDRLECVDQVVISLDKMMIGKIGSEVLTEGSGKMVHLSDKSTETGIRKHLMMYRNHILLSLPKKY